MEGRATETTLNMNNKRKTPTDDERATYRTHNKMYNKMRIAYLMRVCVCAYVIQTKYEVMWIFWALSHRYMYRDAAHRGSTHNGEWHFQSAVYTIPITYCVRLSECEWVWMFWICLAFLTYSNLSLAPAEDVCVCAHVIVRICSLHIRVSLSVWVCDGLL